MSLIQNNNSFSNFYPLQQGNERVTNWNSSLYDDKYDFVFKYGEDVVNLLNPQPGERILDLGCGTGYLTNVIAQAGAEVVGIDSSEAMIAKAQAEYLGIDFRVLSGTNFHFDQPFDAIFSNAALHWILEKEQVVECMYNNLKHGGRLVFEMGGQHNVKSIVDALQSALHNHGYAKNADTQLWYFPSVGQQATLLEQCGFTVNYATYFARQTELKGTEDGIKDWIRMFGNSFLVGIDDEAVDGILEETQQNLKSTNFYNDKWYADYKRLRIVAAKQ